MKKLAHTLLALTALTTATAAAAQAVQVKIDTGIVEGATANGVERMLAIPYAAPPVGQLRWRAPQPAAAWTGVRKATEFGPDCMQDPYPSDAAPLGTKPAEDCLLANVWRPAGTKADAKLPVLVWVYGGGEVNGGASPDVYSGESFARNGVIMVSFNYRVGRFGFFGHPELTRQDADKGLLANYGNMDAIEALRWVKRNIAAFGGDPDQVTIYGQSAGASQIAMLLTTPLARGLFARAIIQSGGNTSTDKPPLKGAGDGTPSIEEAGVNFARRWGIEGTGPEALEKLRALTPEQVTDGIHIGTRPSQAATFTGSIRDGLIIPETLANAVIAGRAAKVPLLIAWTTADNFSQMRAKTLDEAFSTTFAKVPAQARAAYLTSPTADPGYILREMGRDIAYAEPARFIATKMREQGLPTYLFRFGYVANSMRSEWREGPLHATDIPFVMNTVKAKYANALTPTDAAVAETVHKYWVNFVRTGNPNGAGLPQWPAFDPAANILLDVGTDGKAAAIPDPNKARIDAVAAARGR